MNIRHLATSLSGSIAAAAEFERTVHIWDLDAARQTATFNTVLDFGGARLAITGDGNQCVAAAYHVGGVASYDTTSNGGMMWHRADLKNPQKIKLSADGERIICCFDEGPCQELDRNTGETLRKSAGLRNCWESSYESLKLVERRDLVLEIAGGKRICDIRRETFAILSVAFGPGVMCISESGGPIRGIDTRSGKELWRFVPALGQHFLEIGFVEHAEMFAGVCWPYERGGSKRLFCFQSITGDSSTISDLGHCGESAFCLHGSRLLLADGSLLDSTTGVTIKQVIT